MATAMLLMMMRRRQNSASRRDVTDCLQRIVTKFGRRNISSRKEKVTNVTSTKEPTH